MCMCKYLDGDWNREKERVKEGSKKDSLWSLLRKATEKKQFHVSKDVYYPLTHHFNISLSHSLRHKSLILLSTISKHHKQGL